MKLIEGLLLRIWQKELSISLKRPFNIMTYNKAMAQYGSDKPDLRLGMEVNLLRIFTFSLQKANTHSLSKFRNNFQQT
jgi:aspartyl-tRNA synthetase